MSGLTPPDAPGVAGAFRPTAEPAPPLPAPEAVDQRRFEALLDLGRERPAGADAPPGDADRAPRAEVPLTAEGSPTAKGPLTAEAPLTAKDPLTIEAPLATKGSLTAEAPLAAEGPLTAEAPFTGDGPPELRRREQGDRDDEGTDRGDGDGGEAEARLAALAGAGGHNAAELLSLLEAPREPPPTGAARAAEVTELAEKLVERLLVGERPDGTAEIRMTLRGEALGGTEVIVARAEGRLQVQFAPGSADAAELLREHGAELAESLSLRLDDRVVVQVGAQGGNAGDDRRGRSQGHEDILHYLADRR